MEGVGEEGAADAGEGRDDGGTGDHDEGFEDEEAGGGFSGGVVVVGVDLVVEDEGVLVCFVEAADDSDYVAMVDWCTSPHTPQRQSKV